MTGELNANQNSSHNSRVILKLNRWRAHRARVSHYEFDLCPDEGFLLWIDLLSARDSIIHIIPKYHIYDLYISVLYMNQLKAVFK